MAVSKMKNANILNNLPDIDYNDLFCMLSDYYSLIKNLLCSKNKSNYLFTIYFKVGSLQQTLTNYRTNLLI